jgi:hypothetical protein
MRNRSWQKFAYIWQKFGNPNFLGTVPIVASLSVGAADARRNSALARNEYESYRR